MGQQIVTVLCEGPHDVAFICRLLKSIGFRSNENIKIGDYPAPFNQLLINEAKKTDVEQLNLTEVRRNLLPSNVLRKDDNFIFIYSLEGDGKKGPRQRILQELRSFIPAAGQINPTPDGTTLSLAYFFDADHKGIDTRLSEINAEVRAALPEVTKDLFPANGTWAMVSELKLGAFIFTGPDNNTGKLEDILFPLMKDGNEPNFDAATTYLKAHFKDPRLFPLKWKSHSTSGAMMEERSTKQADKVKYDEIKSLIGTVGQLQRSGKSNVVCISDSDYLTLSKIQTDSKCQEILTFFSGFVGI
jgi:hypothetical protein